MSAHTLLFVETMWGAVDVARGASSADGLQGWRRRLAPAGALRLRHADAHGTGEA